jgi:hypothetical protein
MDEATRVMFLFHVGVRMSIIWGPRSEWEGGGDGDGGAEERERERERWYESCFCGCWSSTAAPVFKISGTKFH